MALTTTEIIHRMRAHMADADDLIPLILVRRFSGERCDELVDALRDTVRRIDGLAQQLNGDGDNDE